MVKIIANLKCENDFNEDCLQIEVMLQGTILTTIFNAT